MLAIAKSHSVVFIGNFNHVFRNRSQKWWFCEIQPLESLCQIKNFQSRFVEVVNNENAVCGRRDIQRQVPLRWVASMVMRG